VTACLQNIRGSRAYTFRMKIRTQLIIAFLLLAIVPLTGIVLYSYYSSLRAVSQAANAEVGMLAKEMDGQMTAVKAELGRSVGRVGDEIAASMKVDARERALERALGQQMVLDLGETAPLVETLEVIPQTRRAAPPARTSEAPVPPAQPQPFPVPPPAGAQGAPVTVVIDVPQVLEDVRRQMEAVGEATAEQKAQVQAVDAALAAVADMARVHAPPAPAPAPPVPGVAPTPEVRSAPAVPDQEALRKELRQRIEEQFAHEAQRRERIIRDLAVQDEKERAARALARDVEVPVWRSGEVVGTVKARIRTHEILRRVLETRRSGGEIPFAVDPQGKLYTRSPEDRKRIEGLPIMAGLHSQARSVRWTSDNWVGATQKDPETGLILGIARPVPLQEVRQAAAQNFGYGLGMIGLALLGILPLSKRMTRDVRLVTVGADRIAQGDLDTRVPVRSKNELGTLALAFNRMAEDLKRHQEREVAQARLQTEYERKSRELEDARLFQLSLLPKVLPDHPMFEIAVSMRTATEVGGDYYDFLLADDGALTAAVGDATGHGARAGTMVTAVKSLFSAFASRTTPRELLAEAARAVKRMELERMAMGLCLVRLEGGTLTVSSAGMPPVLLHRAREGRAEEIALVGMPLGGLLSAYDERRLEIQPGDTLLLMTDGLPELTDPEGEPFGYGRVRETFEDLGGKRPEEVISGLTAAAEAWAGGQPAKDDITLVAIRVRQATT
jgi:serine phosphatase RsbU (regulator of sigma subunit)